MGFTKSEADPKLYFIHIGFDPLILVLYMDDLFLTVIEEIIAWCKVDLATKFEMKGIGLMYYFLGSEVWHISGKIFLVQEKYAMEILRIFRMEDRRLAKNQTSI
jgi:hypothetical protein